MTPEGRVKHGVKKVLAAFGKKLWYFMPVQNGMGRVGIPDFVCCVPVTITPDMVGQTVGLFVACETKAPGKVGMLTPNQQREIESIRGANGVAVVADDAARLEQELRVLGVYA